MKDIFIKNLLLFILAGAVLCSGLRCFCDEKMVRVDDKVMAGKTYSNTVKRDYNILSEKESYELLQKYDTSPMEISIEKTGDESYKIESRLLERTAVKNMRIEKGMSLMEKGFIAVSLGFIVLLGALLYIIRDRIGLKLPFL